MSSDGPDNCAIGEIRYEKAVPVHMMAAEVARKKSHIPFPFDHFFFCFLPPVAAGACSSLGQSSSPASIM